MRVKHTETRTFCAVLGLLQWLDNPAAAPSRANVQGGNASRQLLKEWTSSASGEHQNILS